MIRRKDDKDLDALSEIYRSNPPPSKDIDLEAYERKVREQDEKFGKYDEVGNNKYRNKPVDASILEWKADIQKIEDRYKGKATKSWDASSFDLD
jgi:hypothetical protein